MLVTTCRSASQVAERTADLIAARFVASPDAVLGVATGSSPAATYEALARRVAAGMVSFKEAVAFALDEYVGLAADDPASYRSVVREQVSEPLRFSPGAVFTPDGAAVDAEDAATTYESAIVAAGGIDLQIAGIGRNGHLAFNEPGSGFDSPTRVVRLTETTRADNARFFATPEAVPYRSITQGLGTIRRAKTILVIATGAAKAAAVARAIAGPVDRACPASVLQTHPDVRWFLDPAAANQLRPTHERRAEPRSIP